MEKAARIIQGWWFYRRHFLKTYSRRADCPCKGCWAVLTIQEWWRNLPRCRKCRYLYDGNWICDSCHADRHDAPYPRYGSVGIRGRMRYDILIRRY